MTDDPTISKAARAAITNPANAINSSAANIYELTFKAALGKLPKIVGDEIVGMMRRSGFPVIPLTAERALRAALLPRIHRDPWDRLLIGQALSEGLTVVTRDPVFTAHGAATLW